MTQFTHIDPTSFDRSPAGQILNAALEAPGSIAKMAGAAAKGAAEAVTAGANFVGNAAAAALGSMAGPAASNNFAGLNLGEALGGFKSISANVHDLNHAHEFQHGVNNIGQAASREMGGRGA
jgi:hypothetical protein